MRVFVHIMRERRHEKMLSNFSGRNERNQLVNAPLEFDDIQCVMRRSQLGFGCIAHS